MKTLELNKTSIKKTAEVLLKGGLVCFPTDTLYGVLALARDKNAIERLYSIRRPSGRPFLLLVPDISWVYKLELMAGWVHLSLMELLNATFVFYKRNSLPLYLTRGKKSLALRLPPQKSHVLELLKHVGEPVVAPSANPEGEKPATTIREAMEYFRDSIDLYVDGGVKKGKPSTILRAIHPKGLRLVREGSIPFEHILTTYREVRSTFSSVPEGVP